MLHSIHDIFHWEEDIKSSVVDATEDSVVTRVTRTLPFDLSPARWTGTLRDWWIRSRIWQLPRNSATSLLRLITSPDTTKTLVFNFRPEDGPRAAYSYQQRYGYRGQWLIELLGAGYHPDSLTPGLPLPALTLTPPPPQF